MSIDVFAYYMHGPDGFEHDALAAGIMERRGGNAVGKGTDMLTGERDIQYSFDGQRENAEAARAELLANGFRAEIWDRED